MSTFEQWRADRLGREMTAGQKFLARQLDQWVERSNEFPEFVALSGIAGSGQTTLICDWTIWKLRSDPTVNVCIVAPWAATEGAVTRLLPGLLPSERKRLTIHRDIPEPEWRSKTGRGVIVVDGWASFHSTSAA